MYRGKPPDPPPCAGRWAVRLFLLDWKTSTGAGFVGDAVLE